MSWPGVTVPVKMQSSPKKPVPAGKYYIVRCECPEHTVHFSGEKSALWGGRMLPFRMTADISPRKMQAATRLAMVFVIVDRLVS